MGTSSQHSRQWIFWLAALLLGVGVIYFPGLDNGFVFDDRHLESGELMRDYGSLTALKPRMLSYGSFVWVEALVGEGWWKQRVVNLVLHFGVALALLALWRTLAARVRWPEELVERPDLAASRDAAVFLGVAVFAFNPMAVYAVAYLIQRSIVMATLFVVLACLFFVRGLLGRPLANFTLAAFCYLLAMLSKEHALMAPALAVPLYLFLRRPSPRQAALIVGASVLVVAAIAAILIGRHGSIIGVTFDELSRIYVDQLKAIDPGIDARVYPLSLINQMKLFFGYGALWLLPNTGWMSIDLRPAFPLSVSDWKALAGTAGFVGMLLAAAWLLVWREGPLRFLGLCLSIPLLLFATEFATVWIQDPFVLYRSYLWAIAIPGLVLLLFVGTRPKVLYLIALALSVLLIGLSVERVSSFASTLTVWSDAIDKLDADAPANAVGRWRPYLNRGSYYLENDQPQLAYPDFAQADALGELQGSARFNMGVSLLLMKRPAEAVDSFNLAEKRGFRHPGLFYQRAQALAASGGFDAAIADYARALPLESDPRLQRHYRLRRADAAMKARRYEIATEEFQQILRDTPRDYEVRLGLAMSYLGAQNQMAAGLLIDELLAERAHHAAFYGRALLRNARGEKAEALADIGRALELSPGNSGYAALQAQWAAQAAATAQ